MPEGITQHTLGLGSVQAILWLWATRPHLNRGPLLLRARTLRLGAANYTRALLFGGQGERLCLCVRPGCSSRGFVVPAWLSTRSSVQHRRIGQLSTGSAPLCISGLGRGVWKVGSDERTWQRERG